MLTITSTVAGPLIICKLRLPPSSIASTPFFNTFSSTCLILPRSARTMVRPKAEELGIELIKKVDANAGDFEADAKAVPAMLVNLAENSLDACRIDSGKDKHTVTIGATGEDFHVRFLVEDNGIGMDRETRENAFTLFFSSKGSEGTGLGLFIANKIAAAHGGKIQLKSERGVGSRFMVDLPRVKLKNSSNRSEGQNDSEFYYSAAVDGC